MLPTCHVNPFGADNDFALGSRFTTDDLGDYFSWRGILFRLGYNAGSGAGVAGELAGHFLTTPSPGHLTCVAAEWLDGTLGTINRAFGMVCYAWTAGNYAYLQVRGYTTTNGRRSGTAFLKTDGGVVKGDYLVPDGGATPDGVVDTMVAGEEHGLVAQALDDDTAGNLVVADLML